MAPTYIKKDELMKMFFGICLGVSVSASSPEAIEAYLNKNQGSQQREMHTEATREWEYTQATPVGFGAVGGNKETEESFLPGKRESAKDDTYKAYVKFFGKIKIFCEQNQDVIEDMYKAAFTSAGRTLVVYE